MCHIYRFLVLALLFSFPSLMIYGQNCSATAITNLDINNVDATMLQGGAFWWDFNDGAYIVPKDNPDRVSAIFAGGLWFGGFDPGGNLKVKAIAYDASDAGSPGPMTNGVTDPDLCANFDKHWTVLQASIEAHVADFNDNGQIDNPLNEIMSWPGRGNSSSIAYNGFELPDVDLAPFFDSNSNGLYEPLSGEYPLIKGDQAIWWIYNTGEDFNPFDSPDIQASVLAYSFSSADETLDLTTFYDVNFKNAGVESLDSAFVGLWVDADLGCYADDYIGCSPGHNLSYVYNADAIDGDPQCIGIPSYGEEIPVLGIKILKGATDANGDDLGMSSFIYMSNAAVNNPPAATTDPETPIEFYNYLNGHWRDGIPMTFGGDGYSGGLSTDETNYVFTDNPSDPNGWSMCSVAFPFYDRRTLMNSGPFNLQPGQSNQISFAVITVENQVHPCPDITPLLDACEIVKNTFDGLTPAAEQFLPQSEMQVFPNPFIHEVKISIKGEIKIQDLSLFSIDGKLLKEFNGINSTEFMLERGAMPKGIYLLKAQLDNGQLAVGKLVAE
ncbi:MAG: T9SS type A sorting domain-containing protein [Bacteroidota bacterium]